MRLSYSGRSSKEWFSKDPDQLPFFSIHPKTKVGTIIRIALSAFILVSLILTLMTRLGLFFIWYNKLSYLVYIVPLFGIVALVLLGLCKRLPSMAIKVGVTAFLGLIAVSFLYTVASMVAYTSNFALSPKMNIERDGRTMVIMRSCDSEPPYTETITNEDGTVSETKKYLRRVDAYDYTVRVPQPKEGESYTVEGALRAPDTVKIKHEWLDEATLRVFVTPDDAPGANEIIVRFAPSEADAPAQPDASENAEFAESYSNEASGRSVSVYREQSYIDLPVDTPLSIQESDLKQYFVAYPSVLRIFARIDRRVEGVIIVERHGTLTGFNMESLSDDVFKITPTEDSIGASGEIIIYFNEKTSTPGKYATPSDAPATQGDAA